MALFDQKATTYDSFCQSPLGHFVEAVEHNLLAHVATPHAGEQAIDIGCATGSTTLWLHSLGVKAIGVDESREMITVASHKVDHNHNSPLFLQDDATALPFADNTFDFAILNIVLEFVANPAQVLQEAYRVIRPEGRLVIGCIAKHGPWGRHYIKRSHQDPESIYRNAHFFTPHEVSTLSIGQPANIEFGLYVGPNDFTDEESAWQKEYRERDKKT
ncbi:class I SAM-dependent methyltransferase [Sulfoacidibacillus thermotolerans]|uniref:Methyltransferase type 11 domain-containing protein n=1 Tax=Sulfoacidibacillus thermotolerans TaxID=1765684 RepID=A0A2U3D686_SULT2|nr:class I SAM-dependent methyltransferase [Sulfoacidibacillus thermotolerans]PWI56788.1 hypothetical protein BM613_11955 [Sulfoacidibacillus thermotolerans]